MVDFQFAWAIRRLVPVARVPTLRHELKHQRTSCLQALTDIERKVQAKRSRIADGSTHIGNRIYKFVARSLFGYWNNGGNEQVRS